MRVLFANDGFGDAGGVQRYIDAVIGGLRARGHELAFVHTDPGGTPDRATALASLPQFNVAAAGIDDAVAAIRAWAPDVCFSHNMSALAVDRRLAEVAPVVKFMHGYFGTCVSGLKRFALPVLQPCDRVFGPACALLFLPRRCGQLSITALSSQYKWASEQNSLFSRYRAVVVASEHMRREYLRNGVDAAVLHVNPLFPTIDVAADPLPPDPWPSVVFLGRMTALKGGDVLIRAVASASRRLPMSVRLTMVGDGPQRPAWEALAADLGIDCTFTGWQDGAGRFDALVRADLLAVPSLWPEPFGLVGLEAGALGVPSIAFDVGGIREWLQPGVNGVLVSASPPRASAMADALVDAFARREQLTAMRAGTIAVARNMSVTNHLDRLEHILSSAAGASMRTPSRAPAAALKS
jgi:glycosyltransferase involved in cell wall biosynthesis